MTGFGVYLERFGGDDDIRGECSQERERERDAEREQERQTDIQSDRETKRGQR